ncbi:MAG: hypothetical protein FJZ58_00345 [Chlamydiae bacterium]|nr:hypothetical protein [Chlamydiota bacterium]
MMHVFRDQTLRECTWESFFLEKPVQKFLESPVDGSRDELYALNHRVMNIFSTVRSLRYPVREMGHYIQSVLIYQTEELFQHLCEMDKKYSITAPIPIYQQTRDWGGELSALEQAIKLDFTSVLMQPPSPLLQGGDLMCLDLLRNKVHHIREQVLQLEDSTERERDSLHADIYLEKIDYIYWHLGKPAAKPPFLQELAERVQGLDKVKKSFSLEKKRAVSLDSSSSFQEITVSLQEEGYKIEKFSNVVFKSFLKVEYEHLRRRCDFHRRSYSV